MRTIFILFFCTFCHQFVLGQQDSSKQFIPRIAVDGNFIPDSINSLKVQSFIVLNGRRGETKSVNILGFENKQNCLIAILELVDKKKIHFVDINNYCEYRIILDDKFILNFIDSNFNLIDIIQKR